MAFLMRFKHGCCLGFETVPRLVVGLLSVRLPSTVRDVASSFSNNSLQIQKQIQKVFDKCATSEEFAWSSPRTQSGRGQKV